MQARVSDQPAFILRRRDWRNSSLLLDLFSRDYGCLRVLARAARRNPAKTPYQPFDLLSVGWSGRSELKTLTAIEAVALPVCETNYLSLLYVNELIAAMLPAGEANPAVFEAYIGLLEQSREPLNEAGLRRFELGLMRHLGYFPDIATAADSGLPIRTADFYQFVFGEGFVACARDAPHSVSGQTVIDWQQERYQHDAVRRLARSVLRGTIDFNLHGKTLKSREVLREMMSKK